MPNRIRAASRFRQLALRAMVSLTAATSSSFALAIGFEDVSEEAGLQTHTPTAASAWGDLNGDGKLDLWVSNHHGHMPSIYLNNGDGSFREVASETLSDLRPGSVPDYHGAAWADFDGDGDQDLLVLSGGGAGRSDIRLWR